MRSELTAVDVYAGVVRPEFASFLFNERSQEQNVFQLYLMMLGFMVRCSEL